MLNSADFEVAVISVGNLSMGGSGKTPHVEYLLYRFRELLPSAVISRGYRRHTGGFIIAGRQDDFTVVGDEIRQMKAKFPRTIFAVGENRALAIPSLLHKHPQVRLILLDDAFQHRSVRPAVNILLTPYSCPYWKDHLFPVGWLREGRKNATRADVVVVTKCPMELTPSQEGELLAGSAFTDRQKVFFSTLVYDVPYRLFQPADRRPVTSKDAVLLFTGIAGGEHLRDHLAQEAGEVFWMEYRDHYEFDERDLEDIKQSFDNLGKIPKMILTTEKDAVRLEPFRAFMQQEELAVYCLPVRVEFTGSNKGEFDNLVENYLKYHYGPDDQL